jgi:ATP-dependent phosphofructokinase / diphosphate-dependent phosphofructokinase
LKMSGKGNLLIGQSGGPTAVINASLAGVIHTATEKGAFNNIYGMVQGIEGLLKGNLLEVPHLTSKDVKLLAATPASALGSCRYKLKEEDYTIITRIIKEQDIRSFIYIGGNDSMDTCNRIAGFMKEEGYEISVIGVPKTIDNDLPVTDHCPGYGSAARFTAISTAGAGRDLEAMKTFDDVAIMEIMGRHTGWLAASSTLLKRQIEDAPHLVYMPERAFNLELFLEDIKSIHKELGFVFVAIGEGICYENGDFVGIEGSDRDDFGHVTIALSEGPASYLKKVIKDELGLQARYNRCGTVQRSYSESVSDTDQKEAFMVGEAAVELSAAGVNDKMIILRRENDEPYHCVTDTTPLNKVANLEKMVPDSYINKRGNQVTEEFYRYALPLMGTERPTFYRFK